MRFNPQTPMAVLFSAFKIGKTFGSQTLFKDLTFSIESNQRIGLIGPNGAGKSTLLQILAKCQTADEGKVSFANGLRLGYLAQNPEFLPDDTVFQAIANATDDPYDGDNLALVQELISKFSLDSVEAGEDRLVNELSGGWKKRVALARELVKRPTLLLLDEPTNHLDLPSIVWLEEHIARQESLAVLTVTHDRLFLQRTCTLIFDLDRRNPDGLIKFDGSYAEFLDFKEATMSAQKSLEQTRRNVLRRETEWLRRGAKARQTKQKARIDRHGEIASQVDELSAKNLNRRLDVDFGEPGKGPKKMIEAIGISSQVDGRWLFKDFTFQLGPKTRVGLLGRNGCGKSTLIRALIGQQAPDSGEVKIAENVGVAYFEQQKESLDPSLSLLKSICPEGDYVDVQGVSVFARSYLARFHFRGDQMELPVGKLSGGEQARVLIARLMLKKENILVLDEPTNDLDIATLDVLQEALLNFPGAVILVTHDRFFMDQVANTLLVFTEQNGEILRVADFFQWEAWFEANKNVKPSNKIVAARGGGSSAKGLPANGSPSAPTTKNQSSIATPKVKLSYNDQREFDAMEKNILKAEELVGRLQATMVSPEVLADRSRSQQLSTELKTAQSKVELLYSRWQELQDKQTGG